VFGLFVLIAFFFLGLFVHLVVLNERGWIMVLERQGETQTRRGIEARER
jgi:hypothetical protein